MLLLSLLAGCGGWKQEKIWSYGLSVDSQAEGAGNVFSRVMKDYYGKAPKKAKRESGYQIRIICDDVSAQEFGYCLSDWDSNAFAFLARDSRIYLFSPTEKGVERAAVYFAHNFVAENGGVLFSEGDYYADAGTAVKDEVYVGDVPIANYTIVCPGKAVQPVGRELQYYIAQTGGGYLSVEKKTEGPRIRLEIDKNLGQGESVLSVEDGEVTLAASSLENLYDTVYLFLDTYLGWIKTGTDQAHISNTASVIRVPAQVKAVQPWIREREATVVLWNVNYPRGIHLNDNVTLKNNIIDFSEDQLYEYVKMLKFCGFTGVQVTEMCSAWAGAGGYQAVHDKIRILADAAHSLDMKFTLWVWGAEFSAFSWVDPEVPNSFYTQEYPLARENPELVAVFEKYYSIYAELADCCDRVIGHYYDPGNLQNSEDIAFFGKMLRDKFKMVNPDIDFGISCWVDAYDKETLASVLGTDVTFYEGGHHDNEEDYTSFRSLIARLGVRLGTWAWNTCEMEIDQLAQMNFNMEVIRSTYQTARKYDSIVQPSYWSEMDSYHILNAFSLYCAGQLLIDPDKASEVLFEEIATAAVGPEYAGDFAEMLSIIQDARTGDSWDTYGWSNENYILKSEDYPAQQILERCDKVIPVLKEMINADLESYTLPLPISLRETLSMMLPHLLQIRRYAEFRIGLEELEEAYSRGIPTEELTEKLYEVAEPVPDYDCVMGVWGQIEARAQYEMLADFCRETGMEMPRYMEFDEGRKRYILQQIICFQRETPEPYEWASPYYQWGLAYGADETIRLVEELVQEGYLERLENGRVRLTNWEKYTSAFLPYRP